MLFPMVFLAVTTAVVYGRARRAQIALGFADVATVGVAAGKAVTHLAVGEGSLRRWYWYLRRRTSKDRNQGRVLFRSQIRP